MTVGYDNYPIDLSLLLDLKLEEYTGSIVRDSAMPHHTDPTLINAPTWAKVSTLSVLQQTAVNQSIRILQANSVDLAFTTSPFTCLIWLRTTDRDQEIMARGNWGQGGWEILQFNGGAPGQLQFALHTAVADYYISTVASAGFGDTWKLMTCTRTGTGANTALAVYINGIYQAATATGVPLDPTVAVLNMVIGDDTMGGFGMIGYLWRPRIWNRCLSQVEINEIYQTERYLFGV